MWSVTPPNSPQLLRALGQVKNMRLLPDNWDTYGALPVQDSTIRGACYLLMVSESEGLPIPHLVATSFGGVQLEWDANERALELEMTPVGNVSFLLVDGEGEREGRIPTYYSHEARELMHRWLSGGDK